MVISCPECSTRFRVDENKIPAQGAKIRCARCKHIFAVAAPSPQPPVEEQLQASESSATDTPPAAEDPTPETPPTAADDFGFDDYEAPEIGGGTNDEFDPSAFDDDPSATDDDAFSFGDDYGNVSIGDEKDISDEDEPFSFGDPAPAPAVEKPESDKPQDEFSFSPSEQPSTASTDPLASSFEEDSTIDDMTLPPSEGSSTLDDSDLPAPPETEKPSRRSPLSVVILFILVLTLVILVAGGVIVWKNGPEGLEQLVANLTGQQSVTEIEGDIRLSNLQGSFITNRKIGEIFVIRGVAINDLREAQAAIQVKGIIFDKDGKQLLQKTIFCGNPISDNDLRKLPFSKMEEMMGNQFGESLANLNVTPGQSIPFTIVFRKLPKTLSEFVVEVADSKPAAQ